MSVMGDSRDFDDEWESVFCFSCNNSSLLSRAIDEETTHSLA